MSTTLHDMWEATDPPEPGVNHRPLRTYDAIASILAEREGHRVSRARVEQICRNAEKKIRRALRNDPVILEWLRKARRGESTTRDASADQNGTVRRRSPTGTIKSDSHEWARDAHARRSET